jgi:GTP-binding protein HflX
VAVACLDDGLEIDFIGQTLARWRAAGVPLEQIAILSRSHALHYPIEQMLRDRRMPYCLRGERPDYYNRPEIQVAAAYLALALEPTHEALLEKVVNYPPAGIGVRMRYRLRGDGTLTWKHIDQAIEQMEIAGEWPDALLLSAREPADVGSLRERLLAFFERDAVEAELVVPWALQRVVAEAHESARVLEARSEADGTHLRLRARPEVLARLRSRLGPAS